MAFFQKRVASDGGDIGTTRFLP